MRIVQIVNGNIDGDGFHLFALTDTGRIYGGKALGRREGAIDYDWTEIIGPEPCEEALQNASEAAEARKRALQALKIAPAPF